MHQTKSGRVFFFLLAALLAGSWSYAELLYITVPQTDPGLQKSNVSVKLDKKDVPVSEFFAVDTAARTDEILHHAAGRRQYVLVFDLIYSKPEQLVQDRKTAAALIDKLGKEDLAAVAVLSRLYGIRFWSGLTNDRNKLYAALNAVGQDKVAGMVVGPDGNLYSENYNAASPAVELIPDPAFLQNVTAAQNPTDDKIKKKMQDPATSFISGISDLSYSLAGVQGPKFIVLLSPGFDTKGAKIHVDEKSFADSYVDAAIQDETYIQTSEEQRATEEQKRKSLQEQAFQATPAIQVEGIPDFVAGSFCSVIAISGGAPEYEFFKSLTDKTGGLYLRDEKDIASAADRIAQLGQKYYVIGFEGKREKQFRDLHSLKLEAGGKPLKSSDSWVPPRLFEQYTPAERHLRVSEAEYKNFNAPVQGQKFWSDFEYQQGPKITWFSQIPGPSMLKQDVEQFAMEAYGFFIDDSGHIVDFSQVPVRFDLKNKQLRERLNKAGVRVWSMVLGNKGAGTMRWILIDSQFGDTTTWSKPMEIQAKDLTTTNPFIPSTNFDWVIWPKPQDAQTRRGVQIQYPYAVGTDLFFPELNPDVKKDETDKVIYFRIYNKLPESKNPPIHMFLVDNAGKQTEIQQFALMQKPKELEQGGMELFWKLTAVPDVPPGTYTLKVNIRDAINMKDVVREMPLEIR